MPSKVSSVRRARFIVTAFSELPEFWLFGRPDTELSNGCCAHSRRHTDVRTTRPDNSPCLAHPCFPRVYACARHRPPALGILSFCVQKWCPKVHTHALFATHHVRLHHLRNRIVRMGRRGVRPVKYVHYVTCRSATRSVPAGLWVPTCLTMVARVLFRIIWCGPRELSRPRSRCVVLRSIATLCG